MEKYALAGNSVEFCAGIDHDASSTTYRYGGIIIYLVDEGGQITRSTAKVRKQTLKLHKLGAISFATSEEIADGGFTGQQLLNKHADAMGDCWLEYALFGTGAGQPLGMFHAANPARISTTKETAQVADTVVSENILAMEDDLWSESEAGALWLANRETRKQLRLLKVDIGTGGQLVPLFERGQGQQNMLDGFTLWFTDHMKALGDAGDIGICDPRQYAWATKRGAGIEQASSIHLRFDYDETAFRSTWRADGRPLWDQSYTPRNGASGKAESPFVILAERA
jgi:HK97 family phage major capsid protein